MESMYNCRTTSWNKINERGKVDIIWESGNKIIQMITTFVINKWTLFKEVEIK